MNKEILLVAQMVANEKSVDAFTAIEAALAAITAGKLLNGADVWVVINRRTGDYETFRRWSVISDDAVLEDMPEEVSVNQMRLSQALLKNPKLKVGDFFEESIPSVDFSRIDAHTARQIISREIRKAERAKIAETYRMRIGEILTGIIRRISRDGVILDLGDNTEAFLPRGEMLPREEVRLYDRLKVYLYEVAPQLRGPQLLVSRTSPELLVALFKLTVVEVEAGVIEIKRVARDPGSRAKVAVKTNDGRIDPIGMCIGMRGDRVRAVSSELNEEHIDIILWDENPAQLVINAIAPAEVSSITMDEDTHTMDVAVPKADLSRAIGRNGQNVRLATELTGWTLNIMSVEDAEKKSADEAGRLETFFSNQLGIDSELAKILVQEGFSTLEEIAYVSQEELSAISGLTLMQVEHLQSQAKDRLLAQALSSDSIEETLQTEMASAHTVALADLPGMNAALVATLADQGITTRESFAELSIDDLLDITSLDRQQAGELIMAARAHWFNAA